MTAFVFVGPTLPCGRLLPAIPGLVALPPVAQGDLYRAAQRRPRAIGIIDGYFEGVPSVWHKEILWAMAQGIHVFGSASMGALRAAELCDFGMQGVGRIFEAYRAGTLPPYAGPFEDDDEVAVIHGPAETGYVALSEAMVNIRATLAQAEAQGVIEAATRDALARLAKRLFYHDRSYDRLLELAARLAPAGGRRSRRCAPGCQVAGSIRSASMRRRCWPRWTPCWRATPGAKQVDYELEWTEAWDDATLAATGAPVADRGTDAAWLPAERILDELRLDPAYRAVRDRTLLRLSRAARPNAAASRSRTPLQRAALDRLRRRHGLFRRVDLDRWLEASGTSTPSSSSS